MHLRYLRAISALHESRDRDLLASEVKKPPKSVASYVSVQSRPFRYPWCLELSSSAHGGPNGAKARARKFPHFRPGPHKRSARALAPFGPPRADEDDPRR